MKPTVFHANTALVFGLAPEAAGQMRLCFDKTRAELGLNKIQREILPTVVWRESV